MIDVLFPYYGDPDLMRLAVRSVLSQSSDEWRLIVTDDCYPDPTVREWFAALADPRVEYHRNDRNLGANLNYTKAVSLATAEHVVVMGADDVMGPRYVDTVRRTLDCFPRAGVVQPGVEVIGADGRQVSPLVDRVKAGLRPRASCAVELTGEAAIVSVLRGNWTYLPSLCWRRDLVSSIGFRPEYHVVQDLGLLVDVLRTGASLVFEPEVVFQYRRHQGSDSAVKTVQGVRFAEERAYFREVADELRADGRRRAARAAGLHLTSRLHAAALLPTALRTGRFAASRSLVQHALGA